jgi:hypothetical protein
MGKMKTCLRFALLLSSLLVLSDKVRAALSEEQAVAIVTSLPEFVKLKTEYATKPDLGPDIDGPFLERGGGDPSTHGKIPLSIWRIDVYLSNETNGYPWAFFRIDANTGAVFVRALDYDSKQFDWVYLSLADWRKRLNPDKNQNHPLP